MIQDILPLHLQNQYEKKQPDDISYMMIYRENKILVREGETLAFLTYRELREICETAGEMAPQSIYLFSVGEETYFLTELPEHLTPEGYCFEKMFAVRSGKPKEHILAAATAVVTNIENLRRKKKKIKILYFKNLRHTDKCFAPHGQLLGLLFAY